VIFIDSNIPMYLVGRPHRHKLDAQRAVERCLMNRDRLVTDAEAFQELVHRYLAVGRRRDLAPAFTVLRELVDEIFPVAFEDVEEARRIADSYQHLSARDSLHLAIMRRRGVTRILSFDRDFDGHPGIERIR